MKLCLTLLAIVLCCPVWSQRAADIDHLMAMQQYQKALHLLKDLDTSMSNLTRRATCESRLGLLKEAKKSYNQMLHQDSSNLRAIVQLGSIYDQEYDLPKAIKYYRMLLKIDSTNSYYYKLNAQVAGKAGLNREAFIYYARAHKLNPRDLGVMRALSELFLANQQIEQADSILQLAYQEDSTNIQTILNKAKLEYAKKDFGKTVRFFDKTRGRIDLNPYYQKMWGYAYLQIDSFDLAISKLEKLLLKESNEYTHYYLAIAHAKKENWEYAIHHYELAIKDAISPNLFIYHANLGDFYMDQNEKKKAMYHFEEAYRYKKDPKYLFFRARLADEYYKDKQIAINHYRNYLKSKHSQTDWMDYARRRVLYLKEQKHLSNQ